MKITKALQRTAYHEAGHAVTQWALDLGIKEVTIVPSEEKGEAGCSIHKSEFYESCMDLGEETVHQRWAVARLAGHWAQVKWDSEVGDEGCEDVGTITVRQKITLNSFAIPMKMRKKVLGGLY